VRTWRSQAWKSALILQNAIVKKLLFTVETEYGSTRGRITTPLFLSVFKLIFHICLFWMNLPTYDGLQKRPIRED
jgi:hypothetical protein